MVGITAWSVIAHCHRLAALTPLPASKAIACQLASCKAQPASHAQGFLRGVRVSESATEDFAASWCWIRPGSRQSRAGEDGEGQEGF